MGTGTAAAAACPGGGAGSGFRDANGESAQGGTPDPGDTARAKGRVPLEAPCAPPCVLWYVDQPRSGDWCAPARTGFWTEFYFFKKSEGW
eukprot:gene14039-biopygen17068